MLLLMGLPLAARAQDADDNLTRWPFYVAVTVPKEAAPETKYAAFNLPAVVLGKITPDMSDLRLVDAKGSKLPFARRVLRPDLKQKAIPIERRFDGGPTASAYEESFELAPVPLPGHNEIEIHTHGNDFRRPVQVFGSNTAEFANAQSLLPDKSYLVRFQAEGHTVVVDRFYYPYKMFRYLKVRVQPDPYKNEKPPAIDQVVVRQMEKIAGEYSTYPVSMSSEPVRGQGAPGTAYTFELSSEPIYCEKLTLEVDKLSVVERPFRLQIANRGQPPVDLGGVDWRFRTDNDRTYLDLSFAEVYAQRLRLIVTDYANPSMLFHSVTGTMVVRQIVFAWPAPMPLKLYFGNASAFNPNYDFEKRLPMKLEPPPLAVEVSNMRQPNPIYVPPEPEFAERHPWVIYFVLATACAVLAGLLVPLAKKTATLAKA